MGRSAIKAERAVEAVLINTLGIKQNIKCLKQEHTGDLIVTFDQVEVGRRKKLK